jgi:hypothetical protein
MSEIAKSRMKHGIEISGQPIVGYTREVPLSNSGQLQHRDLVLFCTSLKPDFR